MKRLLCCFLSVLPLFAAAQPKVRIDRSPTLGVSYTLVNKTRPGTATVLVKIRNLQNACAPAENCYARTQSGDIYRFEVANNLTRFLTLAPVDKTRPVTFGAGVSRVYSGRVGAEIDTAFVYRMPCTTARPAKVRRTPAGTAAWASRGVVCNFRCRAGDTIYAVRRGIVTSLKRPRERGVGLSALKSTTERTRLTIEHPDGSIVVYAGFAEWTEPLAGEGDETLPGQPLGIVGGLAQDDEQPYYELRTVFCRLVFDDDDDSSTERFPGAAIVGFEPHFATTEGVVALADRDECTAVMTDGLLTAEMSKREAERLKGNKK